MLADLGSDIRYAIRQLRGTPGFALVVVFTLAIGIAVNTTIFSVTNALILRPMAAVDPQDIVAVFTSVDSKSPYRSSSYADYLDVRTPAADVLSHFTVYGLAPVDLWGDKGERVTAGTVSGDYFPLLGVGAVLGRTLIPTDDDVSGPNPVAVLNERLWRERFGADPGVLGKTIRLNDRPYVVVGVLARKYCAMRRLIEVDVFVPITTRATLLGETLLNRESRQYFLLGRLRPGATLAQAQSRLRLAAAGLYQRDRSGWRTETGTPATITVVSEGNSRVPPSARVGVIAFLAFLQVMVGIVLLMACTNLANLALARALGREREMAVRIALGAPRWRLLRGLLIESALLAGAACVAALFLAEWAVQLIAATQIRMEATFFLDLVMDTRVVVFALGITLITALLFGLAPAVPLVQTKALGSLKEGGSSEQRRRFALRNTLIVADVAMTVMLLVPAGLFVRSLLNVRKLDLGFEPHTLVLVSVSLNPERYDVVRGTTAYRGILDRVRSLPGVVDADVGAIVPLSGVVKAEQYSEAGLVAGSRTISDNLVGPRYFATLDIPLLRGRGFTAADGPNSSPVAVVNEAFAREFWPHGDAIGKRIITVSKPNLSIEIVGVVHTGKYNSVSEPATPYVYRPMSQEYTSPATLFVRTRSSPGRMLGTIAGAVQALDPSIPVFDVKTMDQQLMVSIGPFKTVANMLLALGALGLALAAMGLYGLVAYTTSSRKREIAIRMAVGANRRTILRLLVKQSVRLVAAGVGIGIPLSVGVAVVISSFLFGIAPIDVVTYALVPFILGLVALAAVCVPALRATRIPPFDALRSS